MKTPHLLTSPASKKPFLRHPLAIFLRKIRKKRLFEGFAHTAVILAVMWATTGCRTTDQRPVMVEVTEAPEQSGRFRVAERQRDVWIAPHAADNEILQHEQTVTFVEQPQGWRIPATMEPHTVSSPRLPLEEGQYDAVALKRQREMIRDQEGQLFQAAATMETLKRQAQADFVQKEKEARETSEKLQSTQAQLSEAVQEMESMKDAERRRQAEEAEKKKRWWRFW